MMISASSVPNRKTISAVTPATTSGAATRRMNSISVGSGLVIGPCGVTPGDTSALAVGLNSPTIWLAELPDDPVTARMKLLTCVRMKPLMRSNALPAKRNT